MNFTSAAGSCGGEDSSGTRGDRVGNGGPRIGRIGYDGDGPGEDSGGWSASGCGGRAPGWGGCAGAATPDEDAPPTGAVVGMAGPGPLEAIV